MLAQVGLDAVVNSALNLILSPIVLIWFAAASYLMLLLFLVYLSLALEPGTDTSFQSMIDTTVTKGRVELPSP